MKPLLKNNWFSLKTCKTLIFLILATLISTGALNGQDFKKFAFGPGLSINLGVFSPDDVNTYIDNALADYTIVFGNTDMIIYYEVSGFLNFKTRWVDVTPTLAYAISPKIVVGAESFYFTRISPGVLANFFIPMGMSGKNAFFIGGGIHYHIMNFEEMEGNNIGFRAQMGFDMQFGNFNLQPVLAFNIANAEAEFSGMPVNGFEMDYTGGQIGVIMSFHKPVSHRRF